MRQAKQTLFTRIQSRQVPGLTSLPILDLGNGDLAACDLTHTCQRLNEFGLTIAFYTCNAKNFARAYIEAYAMQSFQATVRLRMQILYTQHNGTRVGRRLVDAQQDLASHHQACDLGLAGLAGNQLAGVLATPQNGDAISEFKHLAQLVGDEDDGLPLLHKATQNTEELKCFLRGQDASRLVHNQDVSSAVEDFKYLDPLLQAYRKLFNTGIGINRQPILLA